MPRKIRDVEADLRKAGFVEYLRKGKDSHRSFEHPLAPDYPVYIAGHSGDDAKRSQPHTFNSDERIKAPENASFDTVGLR